MKRTLSASSTVMVAQEQVSTDLGGEIAILHLKAGTYYGLDDVGARIWSLIQEPTTVEEIRDILVNEYEVEPGRCESDLIALLEKLTNEGLVEAKHDTRS